jgi:hypothetical protein
MGQLCTRDDTEVANQDNQVNPDGDGPKALKPAQTPAEEPQPADSFGQPVHDGFQPQTNNFDYPVEPQHHIPDAEPEKQPEFQGEPQPPIPPITQPEPPVEIKQSIASDWENYADFPQLNPAVKKIVDAKGELKKEALQKYAVHYQATQGSIQTLHHKTDGLFYNGEVWRDVPHGYGKMLSKENVLYEGFFTDGKPDRFIRQIKPSGEIYYGEFSNNLPHGYGTKTLSTGETIICENWSNGREDGMTTKLDKNGTTETFKGFSKEGRITGKGFFYSAPERCRYEGNFVEGNLEGQGKKTYDNGKSLEGTFTKGTLHGSGKIVFIDGRRWEGPVFNGEPDGSGKFFTEEGKESTQKWVKGKRSN